MSTYDAEFYWFGPANQVTVTGSFDDWSQSVHMEKTPAGFSGKVKLPYGQKVDYKYVVDGQWQVNPDFPTTYDWQGNINNYLVTPNEPEPVPEVQKSLPTPPPELVIKTPASPANDEPVTPINLPAPAVAVTPMEVPQSAVSHYPDLAVDPVVSRSIVETIVAATEAKETPQEEKTQEAVQPAVEESKAEEPKPAEPAVEKLAPPTITATEIVASPVSIPAEESKPAAEEAKPAVEEATPAPEEAKPAVEEAKPAAEEVKPAVEEGKPSAIEETKPASDDVTPTAPAQPEAVALDSPVKTVASPLPAAEAKAQPPAPAALPLPGTPAAAAADKQPDATTSHFSTTTEGTKPDAPVTPTKKSEDRPGTVKRGSTRSSRVFSFGRRTSHDSTGEFGTGPKTPGTPGTPGSETGRKKKNSFMTK
ncbi:hypothetical protein FRB90_002024, partial [Tulasnella sp. 427]